MTQRNYHKRPWYPWICWLIAAMLYFFQYGLLVFPSVFSEDLQKSLQINSASVGVLFSAFLYTYVLMQVPVGIIYDRFRSRNNLFVSAVTIVIGTVVFAISHNIWSGIIGRMIMGLGGSFAFIGALYLGRSWFPVAMFPLIVGLTEAMSGLSEIGFLPLLASLRKIQHWQALLLEMGAAVLILSILILFFVRERHPERKKQRQFKLERSDFNLVFKNSVMWLLSIYVGMIFAFDMVIANMWGVPLFIQQFNISPVKAAIESGMVMVGFTIGCYLIGWIATIFSDRFLMMGLSTLQFILMLLFLCLSLNLLQVSVIIFFIGFTSSAIILAFNVAKKMIPRASYGLASGFLNMFFGGAGIVVSPVVGYVFQVTNSTNASLIPMLICSFIAMICGIALKFKKVSFIPVKEQQG